MAINNEIIFESNRGIIFEKTLFKNGRIRLAIKNKDCKKTIAEYRYKNATGLLSPYVNWENFNCVDGWVYDKSYLYTAVQKGKKLYAGIAFSIAKKDAFPDKIFPQGFYTEVEVSEIIENLSKNLPSDCILGSEHPDSERYLDVLRYFYICKIGTILDYIDMYDVFTAYERFGVILNKTYQNRIKKLCSIPINSFASEEHMDYANPKSVAEWIVTGLLLGFPIETTVSILSN